MQNLRDKLLKAGLVSEDQAKKVEASAPATRRSPPPQAQRTEGNVPRKDERPPRRDERPPPRRDDRPRRDERPHHREGGGRPQHGRPAATAAERPIPKLPPLPGSKEYQRIESKKQMELDRALRELVLGAQVAVEQPGETAFYFMTRKGKLRRLELTPAQAKQLEDGALGVVERPEPAQIEHSLVPAATAEQMFGLSKKAVRFLNRKENPIGFMSDDDVKAQQEAEAAGTAPEIADEPEAAAPTAEGGTPEGGSSEPSSEPQTQ